MYCTIPVPTGDEVRPRVRWLYVKIEKLAKGACRQTFLKPSTSFFGEEAKPLSGLVRHTVVSDFKLRFQVGNLR